MMRSNSFAPSNLFNERIYELNDNSGSVMTDGTPTFTSNHYNHHQPFRGDEAMIHSRNMQQPQVCHFSKRSNSDNVEFQFQESAF